MGKDEIHDISRREFLKRSGTLAAGIGLGLMLPGKNSLFAQNNSAPAQLLYDLAAVRNGEPGAMFDRGIEALGGMGRFVASGDIVLIKPNASFNSGPERGATTNPALVKRVVEHCFEAGARKVYAVDHTLMANAYRDSAIEQAVKEAGGFHGQNNTPVRAMDPFFSLLPDFSLFPSRPFPPFCGAPAQVAVLPGAQALRSLAPGHRTAHLPFRTDLLFHALPSGYGAGSVHRKKKDLLPQDHLSSL